MKMSEMNYNRKKLMMLNIFFMVLVFVLIGIIVYGFIIDNLQIVAIFSPILTMVIMNLKNESKGLSEASGIHIDDRGDQ